MRGLEPPNDNPFIEASFSTVKRDPEYPGRFRDLEEGYGYFNPYLTWYNQEHYHSGINYVTPDQAHRGLMDRIVAQRQEQRLAQCQRRREVNLNGIRDVALKWGADRGGLVRIRRGAVIDCHPGPLIINKR